MAHTGSRAVRTILSSCARNQQRCVGVETKSETQCGHSASPGSQHGTSPRGAPFLNSHKTSYGLAVVLWAGLLAPGSTNIPEALPICPGQGWEPFFLCVSSRSFVHAGNPLPTPHRQLAFCATWIVPWGSEHRKGKGGNGNRKQPRLTSLSSFHTCKSPGTGVLG